MAFGQKSGLKSHQTKQWVLIPRSVTYSSADPNHSTGQKPWPCRFCPTKFREQSSRGRHEKEQHKGITHFCPYCTVT